MLCARDHDRVPRRFPIALNAVSRRISNETGMMRALQMLQQSHSIAKHLLVDKHGHDSFQNRAASRKSPATGKSATSNRCECVKYFRGCFSKSVFKDNIIFLSINEAKIRQASRMILRRKCVAAWSCGDIFRKGRMLELLQQRIVWI